MLSQKSILKSYPVFDTHFTPYIEKPNYFLKFNQSKDELKLTWCFVQIDIVRFAIVCRTHSFFSLKKTRIRSLLFID